MGKDETKMISIREKDESYDGKIRKMLVEAVEGITVSDEIKLRIQKRIGDENDPRNKAVRHSHRRYRGHIQNR